MMVAFIDDHRGERGVEPICSVLPMHSHENGALFSRPSERFFDGAYAVQCRLDNGSSLNERHLIRIRQQVGELITEIETTVGTLPIALLRLQNQPMTAGAP